MIRIVDYGLGNIQAFMTMFKRLGIPAERARSSSELSGATRLVLPGVGAFDRAMHLLNHSGMRGQLEEMVRGRGVPLLGVCVGMQMLAAGSEEGTLPGLNWIPGHVRAFSSNPRSAALPMPHMGWNDVKVKPASGLLSGLAPIPRFYFLHSYYFDCEDPAHVSATAEYGFDFPCVVSSSNIHGAQCHPEKSHHNGVQLLKNFGELL